jgi:hypothetical protein
MKTTQPTLLKGWPELLDKTSIAITRLDEAGRLFNKRTQEASILVAKTKKTWRQELDKAGFTSPVSTPAARRYCLAHLGYASWRDLCKQKFNRSTRRIDAIAADELCRETYDPQGHAMSNGALNEIKGIPTEKRQAVINEAIKHNRDEELTRDAIKAAKAKVAPPNPVTRMTDALEQSLPTLPPMSDEQISELAPVERLIISAALGKAISATENRLLTLKSELKRIQKYGKANKAAA